MTNQQQCKDCSITIQQQLILQHDNQQHYDHNMTNQQQNKHCNITN